MRESLRDIQHMIRKIPYPKPLPQDLSKNHVYLIDSDHCIMAILECHLPEAAEKPHDYECPVPVKYILKHGYRKDSLGSIIVDTKYDINVGLIIDEKYFEL